ncbi:MAG: conjugative transposon protein TraK [Sphingobacteriales bacterium 50-39]|nr:conjugative transposon protein TraK [Sphingobacteriales bacterium]OJW52860.1 MAG: conjugative transposon protein TraK [Sphingobacteriales bacterium 50-39]
MFKQVKNLDRAFQQVRTFTITVVIVSGCINGLAIVKMQQAMQRAGDRVYILSSGKALEAFAADRKENLPVEARDHVKTFHEYFFTLDPDERVIQANTTRALYLADGSAKRVYDNLKESSYYAGIIAGNISQAVSIDSIQLDMKLYPFYFRCYATQKITRTTTIVTRSLVTEGYLRNVSRSDNNPHGFLIERWTILENKDLKVENR